ncbi:MAG: hypothetical protein JO269_04725 [Burkholderiaceae bacterium]|nr:hypothetical protein [Burkholderiaceae bacterium]
MNDRIRPVSATVCAVLLAVSAIVMIYMGTYASAYYAPAVCLLWEAVLLWRGAARKLFERVLQLNQLTGIILILTLWLGDTLHLPKLDIAGVMLIGNMASGGPLMAVLAIPLLASFHFSKTLPDWFQPTAHA